MIKLKYVIIRTYLDEEYKNSIVFFLTNDLETMENRKEKKENQLETWHKTLMSFNKETDKVKEAEILLLIPLMFKVAKIVDWLNEEGYNLKLDLYHLTNSKSNSDI